MKSKRVNKRLTFLTSRSRLRLGILLAILLAGLGFLPAATQVYAAVELITNGGFESGSFTGWTVNTGGSFPVVQSSVVDTGSYAAYIGDGAGGLGGLSHRFSGAEGDQTG